MHLDFANVLNLVSTVTLIGALIFTGLQVRAANRARRPAGEEDRDGDEDRSRELAVAEDAQVDQPTLMISDEVPRGFRDQVEEYFRSRVPSWDHVPRITAERGWPVHIAAYREQVVLASRA